MTRVLFTCWPFEGHVFPQLSMAIAARERGDDVAFYTDASMRDLIAAEGFDVFPFRRVGPAWRAVHEDAGGKGGRRAAATMIRRSRDWIVGTIPDQVADLRDIVVEWEPEVIGCEASMWGPLVVLSETLDVPVALVSPLIGAGLPGPDAPAPGGLALAGSARARALNAAARALTSGLARPMRRRVDAIRADHGLPPLRCAVTESFARLPLYLVLNVAELDYRRTDLPDCVRYVGPCLWHPPEPDGTRQWLDALPAGRPWVHVTEGTSHFQEPVILRAAAEGLAGADCEAIVTTGQGRTAAQLGLPAAAANVHIRPWLSHDVLLPRCAAIVTSGGMGTVMAALRAGVPLVVVPTTWDKPLNAQRVVDAGVGVRLSLRRCTPQGLRAAVAQVLGERRFSDNARRASEWLDAAPGPAGAAELLERLVPAGRRRTGPDATVN